MRLDADVALDYVLIREDFFITDVPAVENLAEGGKGREVFGSDYGALRGDEIGGWGVVGGFVAYYVLRGVGIFEPVGDVGSGFLN